MMDMIRNADKPRRFKKSFAILWACLALAACGGGGGDVEKNSGVTNGEEDIPTSDVYVQFTNTTSDDDSPLGYISINTQGVWSTGNAGTLDHNGGAGGIIGSGLLSGSIDSGQNEIALSGGGTATLSDPVNTHYARIFQTSGLSNDQFGVVGSATVVSDMPVTGAATYDGQVILQADNGDATFALTGDAEVTVSWGTNDVDSTFTRLSGRQNDTDDVSNVGTISINNATLDGSTFFGGTISTTGSDLALGGGGTLTNRGQFFGHDATEVGGVFVLDSDSLVLSGIFIATGDVD